MARTWYPLLFSITLFVSGCSQVKTPSGSITSSDSDDSIGSDTSITTETSVSDPTSGSGETGGSACSECDICSDEELCVVKCEENPYEGACETTCIPNNFALPDHLSTCDFEAELCGPELVLVGFGDLGRVCGDIVCASFCSICSTCEWLGCDFESQDCDEGLKCSPIDVFGANDIDWHTCLPSGELPPGSACTSHQDHDECQSDSVCLYGICRTICDSESKECPPGSTCTYADPSMYVCVEE